MELPISIGVSRKEETKPSRVKICRHCNLFKVYTHSENLNIVAKNSYHKKNSITQAKNISTLNLPSVKKNLLKKCIQDTIATSELPTVNHLLRMLLNYVILVPIV